MVTSESHPGKITKRYSNILFKDNSYRKDRLLRDFYRCRQLAYLRILLGICL